MHQPIDGRRRGHRVLENPLPLRERKVAGQQYLRIKAFYGTSENAVKTQIWIAVSMYVLVTIVRKRLGLKVSLYQMLQILSLTQLRKYPFYGHFSHPIPKSTYLIQATS